MQTIVVDDNTAYAKALAEDIGNKSVSLLNGEDMTLLTLEEIKEALEKEIDSMQSDETESPQALINRELKLSGHKRQDTLGQTLYQHMTWRHPKVPFFLYSFQQASKRLEELTIPLPLTKGDIPERRSQGRNGSLVVSRPWRDDLADLDEQELLAEKEQACLDYMDEEFGKVQHGFGKVSHTLVNLVRLINGAIRVGKIEADGQVDKLLTLFGSLDLDNDLEEVVFNFLDCAEQRARLVGQASMDGDSPSRQRQVVVVDDEVVSEGALEGESLWTAVLEILFEKDGFRFSTCRPSELKQDLRQLQDKDLVLMDIDFSQDTNYDGASPEFGGRELLKEVHEVLPHLPVVMLSSYDESGLYEECMNRGAYGYLTKDWGSYAKFRAHESEEAWFRGWQDAIEVPLNYRPFFRDTRLLRTLGVVSDSGVESLRTALKNVEAPTIETTKTLVTFFEEFVNGYLHYRGEVPEQTLSDCLNNNVFQEDGLPTEQLLRMLRNNVVHAPSFMNPEVETWLYLLLLRAFMLRLLKPATLEDTAWMSVLTDKLVAKLRDSAALNRKRVVSDDAFFENRNSDIGEANERFIQERNDKIDQLAARRTLSVTELKFHIDGLIVCLAAIFPRQDLTRAGQALPRLGNLQDADVLIKSLRDRSKENGRYKRGFESMASIDWILNLELRDALLGFFREEGEEDREYEGVLRWVLAVRCWLWYFDLLLARPNSLMFESTLRDGQIRKTVGNDVYAAPDQGLTNLFSNRGQLQYFPYYGLRIGLHKVSKRIGEQRGELERQLKDTRSERKAVNARFQKVMSEVKRKRRDKQKKQKKLQETDDRLERMGAAATSPSEFKTLRQLKEIREGLQADLQELNGGLEELEEKRLPPLERKLESATDREDALRVVLQSIRDEESNPDIFPSQVEAMQRSILRKTATLYSFLEVDSFDTSAWIERVHGANSHVDLVKRTEELEAALA